MREPHDREVIPLDALPRRHFCRTLAAGAAVTALRTLPLAGASAALTGCGGSDPPAGPPDAATTDGPTTGKDAVSPDLRAPADLQTDPDLAPPPPDLASAPDLAGSDMVDVALCPPGGFDTGMTGADFVEGTATFFKTPHAFVCRDSEGLYVISSLCTHNGCDVKFDDPSAGFHCPCHGSVFDFGGIVQHGPAPTDLDHYPVCVTSTGKLGFDPSSFAPATKRYSL